MNLNSLFEQKKNRERILAAVIIMLLVVFSIIEYKLVAFIRPLPKYSNVLIFAVINVNLLLILVLSFLVIRNLVKLLFEERGHLLGAKLKTKLTVAFVMVSLLPTILLFFISFQFLQTSLAYWFDIKIERSLEQAITIGRNYYRDQIKQIGNIENVISRQIVLRCSTTATGVIDDRCISDIFSPATLSDPAIACIRKLPINYIRVLDQYGNKIWQKSWLPITGKIPNVDRNRLKGLAEKKGPLVTSIDLVSGTLVMVIRPLAGQDSRILGYIEVGRLIGQDTVAQLEAVKKGFEEYRQLRVFQTPLKTSLLSALFLITLLIIFVSIWFALKLAKSITEPVLMLADATHRVAQGDLNFKLETRGKDELSGLVRAFNTMTGDLKEARRKAEEASRRLLKSYTELEHRKAYIEMLLENVTAGVVSLDPTGKITTINRSACRILEREPSELIGRDYKELIKGDDFSELDRIPQELHLSGRSSIKKSFRINVGGVSKSLIISFSLLKDNKKRVLGILIVFDDLTELEKIQRLAAWREVARRIAHEIKNPLTPIQLSAQRLKRKFGGHFNKKDLEVFKRCTETIINQTDELKKLVNEFSRFARMPAPVLKKSDIAPLIKEIEEIYRPLINVSTRIANDFPRIVMDPEQMKRVFMNIIDNSISAGQATSIFIECRKEQAGRTVISIADDGKGISKKDLPKIFDPYFSRKKGGTGLGLAIVKSIIDAHDGSIDVELNKPKGVIFYIWFEVDSKTRSTSS